jgi:nucleoid-associated protein YgaU
VTPIATSRPAPPPAGTVPARTTPTDEYRVIAKDGEQIREVARKTLGDANAWRKLWDLNPDVDPTQPIPAGTTLRVPR